jgi:hypothetical protein
MATKTVAAITAALAITAASAFAPAMAQYFSAPPGACGYYRNASGHVVPSPCGNWHQQSPPPSATARCADGTYSYSEHPYASGTCSHHGGRLR